MNDNHKIIMFMRRVLRFAMASEGGKVTKLPKAPALLSGELENFRFDAEHARLFDGYTLDELYGSKIGVKHSPAVQAEMRKDTVASILLFVIGFSIIYHLHQLDVKQLEEINNLNDARWSRPITLPAGLQNTLKKTHVIGDVTHLV